jgi:hypothetical protein
MIKKIGIILSALMLVCISANVMADKPTEAGLLHCGCVPQDENTSTATAHLRWNDMIVSEKSRGHRKHQSGDMEFCTYLDESGAEMETDVLFRSANDCEPDQEDNLEDVETCSVTPVDGVLCET